MENHNEVVTKMELNFLRATDALNLLNDKLTHSNTELKTSNAQKDTLINTLKDELSRIKRSLEVERTSGAETNNRLKETVEKLKTRLEREEKENEENHVKLKEFTFFKSRVGDLEREIADLNRRNSYSLELKQATNNRLDKENKQLNLEIEKLKKIIEELNVTIEELNKNITELEEELYEDVEENDEDETEEDAEGISDEKHFEQYEMPDDGSKNPEPPPVLSETEKTKIAILDGLAKHNGRIPESHLLKIPNVAFDSGGLVVLAKGGELTLRRNFLHPSFSLIPEKK